MRQLRRTKVGISILAVCICSNLPLVAHAVNTIYFSPSDAGQSKSVPTWGVDTAWPHFDNVRQSIEHIGQQNVDAVRVLVYVDEPLISSGRNSFDLTNEAKAKINSHLSLAAMAGSNIPLTFGIGGSDPDSIHSDYVSGSGINVANYVRVIKATQEYIHTRPGFTSSPIYAIEPFNEPDFNFVQANPTDLNSIIGQLKNYSEFQNTLLLAPSTLNSDNAQWWYDQVPEASAGSSHLLAGSLTSWINFIDHVNNDGKPFINPEIHSMGEILSGAERGMEMGMVWADVLRGRGTLIRASDGDRLGYAEDLANQSAGAVYRAPDGNLYAFAGGLERDYTGSPSSYRFVSDQNVWFNGIPVREFMLQTKADEIASDSDNDFQNFGSWSSEGAYADIDFDNSGAPALDGYRWKIVSTETGEVMEVFGGGTGNGAPIRTATDNGGLNQLWQITRTRNGYYHLHNAYSGRTAEVANLSLTNGADVRQWGTADNAGQQWYVDEAGNGSFYIRNAHSNKYLDADLGSDNIIQWEHNGGSQQKWQFVLANPTHGPAAHYPMQGDVDDTAGTNHGVVSGTPTYVPGPHGTSNTAIQMSGDDFVQLPSAIAQSSDITVTTWVKWDGGDAWQRIFDFGNDTDSYMFLTPSSAENTLRFAITETSNGGEQVLETDPLPVGEWVHLTLTLGGNTGILYVNGAPKVAGQILLNPANISPANNYIGKSQWPDPLFQGAISDFQIYDYALAPEQVQGLLGVDTGDFNGDGLVNLADYVVWRSNLGADRATVFAAGSYAAGGIVNSEDYLNWKGNFGADTTTAALNASAMVPEPRTAWLLTGPGCLALLRRIGRLRPQI